MSGTFRIPGKAPLEKMRVGGHAAAGVLEYAVRGHFTWQRNFIQEPWPHTVDLDQVLSFIDKFGYSPPGYTSQKDSPNGYGADGLLSGQVNQCPPGLMPRLRSIFQDTGFESIPSSFIAFAYGHLLEGHAGLGDKLAHMMMAAGYQTFRHVVRMGLSPHAEKKDPAQPSRWVTETSDEMFDKLAKIVKKAIGTWEDLDTANFSSSTRRFSPYANRETTRAKNRSVLK